MPYRLRDQIEIPITPAWQTLVVSKTNEREPALQLSGSRYELEKLVRELSEALRDAGDESDRPIYLMHAHALLGPCNGKEGYLRFTIDSQARTLEEARAAKSQTSSQLWLAAKTFMIVLLCAFALKGALT